MSVRPAIAVQNQGLTMTLDASDVTLMLDEVERLARQDIQPRVAQWERVMDARPRGLQLRLNAGAPVAAPEPALRTPAMAAR